MQKPFFLFFFFILFVFCQLSGFAQGWQWQNPYPTGQELNDVHFGDECTGWLVGQNGTIFKTLSGGNQWFKTFDLSNYDFKSCFALDNQRIWVAGHGIEHYDEEPLYRHSFKILHSSDGGTQWETVLDGVDWANDSLNFANYLLKDIHFTNNTYGWAAGDSGLLVSSDDGGLNWQLHPKPTQYDIETIQFIDESVGYLCGGELRFSQIGYPYDSTYSHGVIMKTLDGGDSWQAVFDDSVMIHQIHFLNAQTGWAVGTAAWMTPPFYASARADYIYKTTNGGQSWQHGTYNGSIEVPSLSRIYFANSELGFALGYYGRVLRSTDGGATWHGIPVVQRSVHHFGATHFTDDTNGYIVGHHGAILQTEDGGTSWTHYDHKSLRNTIWHVYFLNTNVGWMTTIIGDLYKTEDGGDNWVNTGIGGVYAIDFVDSLHGWAVGEDGAIWYSPDTGTNWYMQNSPTNSKLRNVKFYSQQIGWIVGSQEIYKTTDGGQNWFIQNPGNGGDDIILQDSLRLWISAYYTQDGGNSWYSWGDTVGVRFFLNPDTGWAKSHNYLLRTFNGGQSWDTLNFGASATIFFVDADNGWSSSYGWLSATTDGGFNWDLDVDLDPGYGINDFYFIDENHGWAVGISGSIIRHGYPEKAVPIDSTCDKITSIDYFSDDVESITDVQLFQNYPNPFNDVTVIRYKLNRTSRVYIKIFDILGKEVRGYFFRKQAEGFHQVVWDGRDNQNRLVGSGIYFYRLTTISTTDRRKNVSETHKLLLIK